MYRGIRYEHNSCKNTHKRTYNEWTRPDLTNEPPPAVVLLFVVAVHVPPAAGVVQPQGGFHVSHERVVLPRRELLSVAQGGSVCISSITTRPYSFIRRNAHHLRGGGGGGLYTRGLRAIYT